MPAEKKLSRAEMLTKPVSRIQMYANRNPYNYEAGSVQLANRETARKIWNDYNAGKLTIYEDYFITSKSQRTMTKKRTKPAKASSVMKKAQSIYDEQKETYQKMLKTKVRQGKKVTTAAKEASKTYKELYGATPTARWKRALREAKHS